MGEYTGLRFKAVIKPEYSKYFDELVHGDVDSFQEMYNYYPQELPFLKEFVETKRYADAIGICGGDSYMPDTWSITDVERPDTWELFHFYYDESTRVYTFATVNKNTDDSMQFFLKNVAHHFIEEVIAIYTHYNHSGLYSCYDLVGGKLEEVALLEITDEGYAHTLKVKEGSSFELTDVWKKHVDWDESFKPIKE